MGMYIREEEVEVNYITVDYNRDANIIGLSIKIILWLYFIELQLKD